MSRKVSAEQLKLVRDWRVSGLSWEQCRLRLGDAGVEIQVKNLAELCRRNAVVKVVRGQVRYEPWCAPNARRVQGQVKAKFSVLSEKLPVAKSSYVASVPANRTDLSGSVEPVRSEKVSSKQVVLAGSGPGNYATGESEQVIPVIDQPGLPGPQEVSEVPAARVDKLEKSIPVAEVPGPTVAQVPEPAQPAEVITKDVIAPVATQAIQASPVSTDVPGILTKEERDARRRALIAGAPAAQAKLDAEKAAQEKVAREIQENEARMDKIRKEIALEKTNRVALTTKRAFEEQ